MVKFLALTFVIISTSALSGQMLDNRCGDALEGNFCFDQSFLSNNGIDSIEVSFQKKRTGKKLWQSNDVMRMAFDSKGRMREFFQTRAVSSIIDSTHILYTFDEGDTWIKKQEKDSRGYFIESPVFDDEGRMTERHYYKAPAPQRLEDNNPIAGTQVNRERYTYSGNPEIAVTTIHNNYDLPYSRKMTERSPEGFLKKETEDYLVTGRKKSTSFTYNERGWIRSTSSSDSHRKKDRERRYAYDKVGNLTQMEVWQNGVHTHTWEVVYDELGRIDGIIIVEQEDNAMDIWNFSYPEES